MNISVLGSGGWGTALALLLLENGHEVTLWSFDPEELAVLQKNRENPLLQGVPLPDELKLTNDMACVKGCEVVVLATPSFAVRETARKLDELVEDETLLVLVTKGIEQDTSMRLSDVVRKQTLGRCPVVVLCGPSHAEEVARAVPTAVVAAGVSQNATERVQDLFMCPRFRVYSSPDTVGVELGAAMKNVIALCVGCCDGMGYGDNTKAALMTRGLSEMARLGVAMGAHSETFAGLTGVGDLIVTCTSMHSRNRRAGILIGQGVPVAEALQRAGGVVEGYYATKSAKILGDRTGVELPITQAAYEVLYEGKDVRSVMGELMIRSKKHEIEKSWLHV